MELEYHRDFRDYMEDLDVQLGVLQPSVASFLSDSISTDLAYSEYTYVQYIPFLRICAAKRRVVLLFLHVL